MATLPFQVKALYDYSSKEEDDLNFPAGQVITVTDVEDDDWYFGEYADTAGTKQDGLFPKNFVKPFEPETPPRPSRTSKSKRELEPLSTMEGAGRDNSIHEPKESTPLSAVRTAQPDQDKPVEKQTEEPRQAPLQSSQSEPPFAAPPQKVTTKPPPVAAASKPAPPSTAEKPTSGSFRDRINAFNKPAAPPVAPMKPSGLGTSSGSGFIKKPFVAPPPSKDAYVPPPREPAPQKVYRREEDSEFADQASNDRNLENQTSQPQVTTQEGGSEDQPKPASLKDRIALLQKQQMEQAARRAEPAPKKEKPARPSKKPVDPEEQIPDQSDDLEGHGLEKVHSEDSTGNRSTELARDALPPLPRTNTRPRKSREVTPMGSPTVPPSKEILSDSNDADQSGIGDTEDGEELSTGRDDSDEKPQRKPSIPPSRLPQAPTREADVGDGEDNAEEDDAAEEEEEDVDPEVKRRQEIRERMAKMSGGMGMAGMFGPPGGLPSRSSKKQPLTSSERKVSGDTPSGPAETSASRAAPVPIMPMPGLQKIRSPESSESRPQVSREVEEMPKSLDQGQNAEDVPDIEDLKEEPATPSRRSTERALPPPPPSQDRPIPAPPGQIRGPPPPVPTERPVAPQHSETGAISQSISTQPLSPSDSSESDDEMSLHNRNSMGLSPGIDSRPISQGGIPPMPSSRLPPSLPNRPAAPPSRPSDYTPRTPEKYPTEISPISPTTSKVSTNRSSRVPPIPGSVPTMASVPQGRPPPPPPPANVPPPSIYDGEVEVPPMAASIRRPQVPEQSDEEVTEYEGDYDTDIASSATHKDALKSHTKGPTYEDISMIEEPSFHHSSLPSLGPAPSAAPRDNPPPLPTQPPHRQNRQSSDMPRAAPPPLPPPRELAHDDVEEGYDPYKYTRSAQPQSSSGRRGAEGPITPRIENSDPLGATSPPQRAVPPPLTQTQSNYGASQNMPVPSRSGTGARQSMDVPRSSTNIRRSTEGSRPSGEQGFIASDVDLGEGSLWWARPDAPPPIFQNRQDLIFEIEETSTTRRGGKQAITKIVYVLFMDYSQTVITAHFETKDPSNASLEQRHEPPPQPLRQDQLENAHTTFGSRIAGGSGPKEGSVVGDGSPNALILSSLSALPDALLPVGLRAYGALVYANLANASVRQFDEIRPGDIVTFRNAKFQGHRGTIHSKYSIEVGKPDHVGIVIDWDGTKKKVRAWEQGRESKKVKSESFKLGDMRSGEVKVWRVMARSWVGWEGQN